jgi:hypothetical protein
MKIPSFDVCKKFFNYCKANRKTPVLLTPPLTDYGIKLLKTLIPKLVSLKNELDIDLEITINDFGLIDFLKQYDIKVNLGRMQVKMKKGPEVLTRAFESNIEELKFNSLNNNNFLEFFKNENITRFECDIPLQGIVLPKHENITIYIGNSVISCTRRCPYIDSDTNEFNYEIKPCKRECLKSYLVKNTKYFDHLIYVIGNAEFLKTSKKIDKDLKNCFNLVVIFRKMEDLL